MATNPPWTSTVYARAIGATMSGGTSGAIRRPASGSILRFLLRVCVQVERRRNEAVEVLVGEEPVEPRHVAVRDEERDGRPRVGEATRVLPVVVGHPVELRLWTRGTLARPAGQ